MVLLDYRTDNPRWGLKGIAFSSWQSYSFVLGYLSSPAHNYQINPQLQSADISIRIERNDKQGAWNKEGRIHFYGSEDKMQRVLPDLYDHCSAGVGAITKRNDSNGYIISLIEDYEFILQPRTSRSTADVFPPNVNIVENLLIAHLTNKQLSNLQINDCVNSFWEGYNF